MITVPDNIVTHDDMLKLQRACIETVEHYIELAKTKLGIYLPRPKIVFDIKGKVAGRAWPTKNLIQFNPLIAKMQPNEFLGRTPGHEVAHLIAWIQKPSCDAHGDDWRRVMWAFSLPAIRCHSYDTNPMAVPRKRPTIVHRQEEGMIIKPMSVGRKITFE
jgi:predicted SprT family Zn-dependent metalloprotease